MPRWQLAMSNVHLSVSNVHLPAPNRLLYASFVELTSSFASLNSYNVRWGIYYEKMEVSNVYLSLPNKCQDFIFYFFL